MQKSTPWCQLEYFCRCCSKTVRGQSTPDTRPDRITSPGPNDTHQRCTCVHTFKSVCAVQSLQGDPSEGGEKQQRCGQESTARLSAPSVADESHSLAAKRRLGIIKTCACHKFSIASDQRRSLNNKYFRDENFSIASDRQQISNVQ